jgi:hypothetical protein
MKEIATYMGGSGNYVATIYEVDNGGATCYTVSCARRDLKINPSSFSKVFMTEEDASNFASEFISSGNKPTFLTE